MDISLRRLTQHMQKVKHNHTCLGTRTKTTWLECLENHSDTISFEIIWLMIILITNKSKLLSTTFKVRKVSFFFLPHLFFPFPVTSCFSSTRKYWQLNKNASSNDQIVEMLVKNKGKEGKKIPKIQYAALVHTYGKAAGKYSTNGCELPELLQKTAGVLSPKAHSCPRIPTHHPDPHSTSWKPKWKRAGGCTWAPGFVTNCDQSVRHISETLVSETWHEIRANQPPCLGITTSILFPVPSFWRANSSKQTCPHQPRLPASPAGSPDTVQAQQCSPSPKTCLNLSWI